MSNVKKHITKEEVLNTSEDKLDKLFNSDVLLMDVWSGMFYEEYLRGTNKNDIIEKIEQYENNKERWRD